MREIIDIRKYTIIKTPKPDSRNVNELLQWLGISLGLFSQRDKDKSCFRIFIELLKASKHSKLLSSEEIAQKAKLSRATVVHHLNKLMESGLIESIKNRYKLKEDKLEELINSIEKEINKTLNEIKEVSRKLDILLGL